MFQTLTCTVSTDEYTDNLETMFDYGFKGVSRFTVPILPTLPDAYGIGLIVGSSGSGKSSLLKQLGGVKSIAWDESKPIVSQFGSMEDAIERLSAVGLNSIPSWAKPYHILSNGEQFRANLARTLSNNALIDEFTSVVDRIVAKSSSYALRRYVDQKKLNGIIIASVHRDIIEWLQPDWIFDLDSEQFTVGRSLHRPEIKLSLYRTDYHTWNLFKDHHYLSSDINKASTCYVAIWNDIPVAFNSILAMPSPYSKNLVREHRLVVLPDYQGLGIGYRVSEATAEIYLAQGKRYYGRTSHFRLGGYRESSLKWIPTSKNRRQRTDVNPEKNGQYNNMFTDTKRVCYSHEYIGDSHLYKKQDLTSLVSSATLKPKQCVGG